jgi:two-component system, NtrC family, response regulator AtoC
MSCHDNPSAIQPLPTPAAERPSCQQIIDILPEPFVVIDRSFRIVAANRRYREHYGVTDSSLLGRRCHEVSHHSDLPCGERGEHCPLQEVVATGKPSQVMHAHYDRHGQEETVQLQATPLFDANGEVLYIGEYISPVAPRDGAQPLIVGRSRPLMRMVSLLQRLAPTQTTVLLLGESGVGKECAAQYLHDYSNRANGPFVVIDCGTLGENLIESELFGHEKGAFTGAAGRKLGLFEAARGGTLFIDEICELPLPLQTKLLRVLETGCIRRIGGTQYVKVDVRIVAATNRDVRRMVQQGLLREDLYYRLAAFPVHIPTLRERKDDVPALAAHFLAQTEEGDQQLPLSAEVIEALLAYDYPGNVRELRNIIERAAILASDEPIRPEHLVFEGAGLEEDHPRLPAPIAPASPLRRGRVQLDSDSVRQALEDCHGHRRRAADLLGVSERTLYRYLRRSAPSGTAATD